MDATIKAKLQPIFDTFAEVVKTLTKEEMDTHHFFIGFSEVDDDGSLLHLTNMNPLQLANLALTMAHHAGVEDAKQESK